MSRSNNGAMNLKIERVYLYTRVFKDVSSTPIISVSCGEDV